MGTIRLSKLIKEYNVGLNVLTEYLRSIGYSIDDNPNAKVDDSCLQQVATCFRRDLAIKIQSKRVKKISSVGQILPEEKDYEDKAVHQKKKIAPARAKIKANITIYASPNPPIGANPISQKELKGSTNPPVINDQMDWDIFSASPSNQTVYDDLPTERPEWEITLEKAVMNIPSPVDEALKTRILGLVSEWLDHKKEAPVPQHKYAPDDEVVQ